MRHASVVVSATVAVLVTVSVGGCAATPTTCVQRGDADESSRPSAPAPAASASVAATSSTDAVPSPATSTSAAPSPSPSFPAGATIDGRIQVGDPVAPRWFAADDTVALGPRAHEPGARGPGDVRRHGTRSP